MGLTRPRYSSIQDTDYKQSVRVATTADVGNLLATGNMTNSVDGITVAVSDRILVKDQNDLKQNGIYFVIDAGSGSNGTWRRSLDADASYKVTSGMTTTVTEGNTNINKTFKLTTLDPITLGTSELSFVNPFVITAGAAGSNTYVQFNDTGAVLGGTAGFTFNRTSNTVSVAGSITTANLIVNGNISATYFLGDGSRLSNIDYIQNTGTIVKTYNNGNVTITGNLVPSANLTYNLGSPTQRWATGYFAGNTIDLGGATISVNTSTGVFTFAGNNTSSTVSLGGSSTFEPTGDVRIGGNLLVNGAVYLAGNSTTFSTNNVVFNDALIYLADGNPTDFLDLGFIGNFTRSSLYQHSGFARDATDGVWKLFEGVEPEPTTTIDFGSASYSTALIGNLVTRSNITVGGNIRLGKALLSSAGVGGDPGQYLTSTGTGIAWTTLEVSSDAISDATNSSNVTATSNSVDVWSNGTHSARFYNDIAYVYTSLTVSSEISAASVSTTGNITAGNVTATRITIDDAFANTITLSTTQLACEVGDLFIDGALAVKSNVNTRHNSLGVGTSASGTAGEIRATNAITAFYSDRRLKTNFRPIENALDRVDQLTGLMYTQNELAETFGYNDYSQQVGVFAQDVQQVQPEAVKPAPFDIAADGSSISGENYLTVQYEKLVPLLIEAIKELRKEINQLKGL